MEECITKAFSSQIFQKSLDFLESELSDSKDTIEDIVVSFTKPLKNMIISGKSLTRNHNRLPNKKWFDEECKNQKRSVNKMANVYKRNPNNFEVRRKYFCERKK